MFIDETLYIDAFFKIFTGATPHHNDLDPVERHLHLLLETYLLQKGLLQYFSVT